MELAFGLSIYQFIFIAYLFYLVEIKKKTFTLSIDLERKQNVNTKEKHIFHQKIWKA